MWSLKLAGTVLLSILLTQIAHGDNESTVLELNDETFDKAISQENHFVMFFAPWCGHCKRLHPLWDELAAVQHKETDDNVVIAKVDCTENKIVCTEQEITGYPTLRFFKRNERDSVKFKGTRDMPAFVSFINEQLNRKDESTDAEQAQAAPKHKLVELTDSTFPKHVSSGKHFVKFYAPWCSHCQHLAPTWEQLAKALENEATVSIAKIDCTVYRAICQDFDVKGYPTLLWIEDGKKIEKYAGGRDFDVLQAYVEKMLGVDNSAAANAKEEAQEKSEDKKGVLQITGNEFEKTIAEHVTFVKFFAPWCGHCQKLNPTWEKLAEKMHTSGKYVKIAKVDCTLDANRPVCIEQHVQGYPTLNIYRNGVKIAEYDGARSLPELENYVSKVLGHDEL